LRNLEVVLGESSISRHHAEILLRESGWVLRDSGSTNGTFLNGNRVGRTGALIRARDVLQFGTVVLIVDDVAGNAVPFGESPADTPQVQVATKPGWEEDVDLAALEVTRSARPGEQMLSLLRAGHHFCQSTSLDELFVRTVITLAQAIELRDDYTGGHTQRVTDYSLVLAEELGLGATDRQAIQIGAPIHDIGKIGISDAVLRKPGRLTLAEFEQMKSHTVKGAAMLGTIPDLESIIPIVRNHHERWDGTGYPDHLHGTQIPRLARLVAVADAFDAMTSDRPYRIGMTLEGALAEIGKGGGNQFDPECVAAFLEARPRIEQLFDRQRAQEDTANMGKMYDVHKLLALARPA
jgi:putative nucleotidyltransferase with HDIG domain